VTDQSSVVSFIENNWLRGQRIGHGSFDVLAGNLAGRGGVLDFHTRPNFKPVILNPSTGAVVSKH
jgi:phospholipase C